MDLDDAAVPADDAVLRHVVERGGGGAQAGGIEAVALGGFVEVNAQVAHQLFDDVAAQAVLGGEGDAAGDGQVAGGDGGLVGGDGGCVLHVALGQGADGGGAEAEEDGGGVGGVALEVAAHGLGVGGDCQGVVGAGVVIEPDTDILLLIGAADVAECVGAEFPTALAVDAASLCVESDMTGWRGLAAGTVAGLMGSRAVLFRSHAAPDPQLHEAACLLATHEALVRIPGDGPPAMLALAARDGMTLDPLQGAGALAFLGRALAVALGR